MHIAIDALLVYQPFTGVEHVILHQLRALLNIQSPHQYTIIVSGDEPITDFLGPVLNPYKVFRAPLAPAQKIRRTLWQQLALPRVLEQLGVDLLYSPGYLTSLGWAGKSVSLIHDTIALSHPELCRFGNALNYRLLLPASARHSTLVVTPSRTSADDVTHFCGVPADHIRVVPLGVNIPPTPTLTELDAARQFLGFSAPYLLAVSAIEPKKNFAVLIRWFASWRAAGIPQHLVIVGNWAWNYADVKRALVESPVREFIHLPGYLEQTKLPAFIAGADLLLMPSLYEGFGLPALEGMAIGTPVVVSDSGSLPEVVGDAGLVVPLPGDAWITAIPELLLQPEQLAQMRLRGPIRAATFPWSRTAELLLQVFSELDCSD